LGTRPLSIEDRGRVFFGNTFLTIWQDPDQV